MTLASLTKNHPYRHPGVSSNLCNCGLVHDDELKESPDIRLEVIKALGGKCANSKCRWLNEDGTLGCVDVDLLQIDHVNDDGFMEKQKRGGRGYWGRVLKQIQEGSDRYQLLCANCNWAKRKTSLRHGWNQHPYGPNTA